MIAFLIRWVKENMVLKLILPLSFLLFFHVFCKVAARKFKVTPMACVCGSPPISVGQHCSALCSLAPFILVGTLKGRQSREQEAQSTSENLSRIHSSFAP